MPTKILIGIFLASSGSRGDHLLFKYPYETEQQGPSCVKSSPKNPYALQIITEDVQLPKSTKGSSFVNGVLVGYTDTVLANLLAVKANLCGRKFEVKIDDVTFIGHPLLLHPVTTNQSTKKDLPTMISFNVVLALKSPVDVESISCYHDLTKQLAIVLRHEERRCELLSKQKNDMLTIQDEVAAMTEDSIQSPYKLILEKCKLAQQLRQVYDELYNTGVVQLYINKWIHINWCLPHAVHRSHQDGTSFLDTHKSGAIHYRKLIKALRPYHGMLLLIDGSSLIDSLQIDASPSLSRLIKVTSPFKNLQNLASDADLSLAQVYQLVTHLVYWSKATIIYPLCEANIYVLSPNINTSVNSCLVEKFVESFPGVSLPAVLSEFSVPSSLRDHKDVLGLPQQQVQEVQIVTWLLQHHLLVQLHTYVFLTPRHDSHRQRSSTFSQLGPMSEESFSGLWKASSNSDLNSVNSDESQSMSTLSAKSPSLEGLSDLTEEVSRTHWHTSPEHLLASLQSSDRHGKDITDQPEDLKFLARLCPYFDGKHHLEEIMYYENVRRSQLLTTLDKFRDILITCQHMDPGISYWATSTDEKRQKSL